MKSKFAVDFPHSLLLLVPAARVEPRSTVQRNFPLIRNSLMALLMATIATVAAASQAAAVVITYTTFSDLAGATFGGSGIPTNPTTISAGSGITVGLTAFGRFQNPALSNHAAGTFHATPGTNDGLGAPPHSIGTSWGFGDDINARTAMLQDHQIDLT